MSRAARLERAPLVGFAAAVLLMGLAVLLPALGWDVRIRYTPPLHGVWDPRVGPGTLPAVLLAVLAAVWAIPLAERLPWRWLLVTSYVAGLGWLVALAMVDGPAHVAHEMDHRYEYLPTAREIPSLASVLPDWAARIPYDGKPDDIPGANWPVHVAGHPPGALAFFVVLVRLGLGAPLAAAAVVTLVVASTALGVMVTLRVLGAEQAARRAAPFLVLAPAAIWQAVSGDGVFAAFAAWGLAVLAVAATRRSLVWSLAAGVLLGWCVMLSYGLILLGFLSLAVLVVARSWKPLVPAAVAAAIVVLAWIPFGYTWWESLHALRGRYWDGVASRRPAAYWMWGNFAALLFSTGPLAAAGLTRLRGRVADLPDASVRAARWLAGAALLTVVAADLSQMSKAEVERIWLPFAPWLLVACALLPERWRRVGVVLQVVLALAVQHLVVTGPR